MINKNPYIQSIREDFDWKKIKNVCMENTEEGTGICFIGTIFSLMPSGKYYTPWAATNVIYEESIEDELYWEALNKVAEENDCWITTGEGDSCDILVCFEVESKDDWIDD